ncbi:glycosyltransferase [Desulfovibrio inopinatus]|uniref:glycosyltransferase family protein n=1 Tax=Desulfovibrio inopinatus TaxID=102109 RepID=UPI00048803F0|nr:glycosyltransferase [Desulfovibrio inopinatus]
MTASSLSLVWVGNPYFSKLLANHGFTVTVIPRDVVVLSYADIVEAASGPPDVVVYGDCSGPPPLTDVANFPCLTVFFCVDSHIHSWYPFYAQAFDLLVLNLKDNLPQFLGKRLAPQDCLWMPLYAKSSDRTTPEPQTTDLLFVGKVDPETTPIRATFLKQLRELVPGLVVTRGNYRTLYPSARIVLNIAERGDFNFRVFEAMGCGCCLLTPHTGHGLDELFVNGRDLHCYRQNDVHDAAAVAARLLEDDDLRAATAARAVAAIDAGHRDTHRAASLAEYITKALQEPQRIQNRQAQSDHIHSLYLKLLYLHFANSMTNANLQKMYLEASQNERMRG